MRPKVTKAQEEAARRSYEQHRAACRRLNILPEHFSSFLKDFLATPKEEEAETVEPDQPRRSYECHYSNPGTDALRR